MIETKDVKGRDADEDDKIFSIGNAIKHKWFTPEVLFKKIKEE